MTNDQGTTMVADDPLPEPRVRRSRWPTLLIWLVPVAAAILAGVYLRDYFVQRGPIVTIRVDDADGIEPGETPVRSRGVKVGVVSATRLSDDGASAIVQLRLDRSHDAFARSGARFWVVKPEFDGGNLNALTTVISGRYVAALPGDGEASTDFAALDRAPLPPPSGLRLTLLATALDHLGPDAPIYYRGILAGSVRHARLASDASRVEIDVTIRPRYQALIRENTVFWRSGGADVKGGIFSGIDVKVGSIRSLISGGLSFATPDENVGQTVPDGTRFLVSEEEPKNWEQWTPNILVLPDPAKGEDLDSPTVTDAPAAVPLPAT